MLRKSFAGKQDFLAMQHHFILVLNKKGAFANICRLWIYFLRDVSSWDRQPSGFANAEKRKCWR